MHVNRLARGRTRRFAASGCRFHSIGQAMAIIVRCGECGARLKFRDDALGKRAKCAKCGRIVEIRPDSDSRQPVVPDGAEFLDEFAEVATAAAASNNSQGTFRPNPQPRPAGPDEAREPRTVEEPSDERVVLGVRMRRAPYRPDRAARADRRGFTSQPGRTALSLCRPADRDRDVSYLKDSRRPLHDWCFSSGLSSRDDATMNCAA